MEGTILLDGQDIYSPAVDVTDLHQSWHGFQKVNPFPKSYLSKCSLWSSIAKSRKGAQLDEIVEKTFGSQLWEEAKDRLHDSALGLSGGQQQRLCIARAWP